MKKLIVVRAGCTAWQNGDPTADECRIQGTVSLPLTDRAKQSLQETAARLQQEKPDLLYSSGNESSGPTAEYLADLCHMKPKKLKALHELDCGLWQGLRIVEIKKRYGRAYRQWRSDPTSVRPAQGETILEAYDRIDHALQILYSKNLDKTIVVVAAWIVAALIECIITGTEPENIWQIVDKNHDLHVYDFQENSYSDWFHAQQKRLAKV